MQILQWENDQIQCQIKSVAFQQKDQDVIHVLLIVHHHLAVNLVVSHAVSHAVLILARLDY
jgi:hypothetical protein